MVVSSHTLAVLTLFGPLLFSAAVQAGEPPSLEVYIAEGYPISRRDDHRLQGATVTVHAVDALEEFESALSQNLPANADAAKAEALRRIGKLNDARTASAKDGALGLANAVQHGVDRYPAVVVNGIAVVYGVTDLAEVVARYEAWREVQAR